MENLLNYTSDSSSEHNSDSEKKSSLVDNNITRHINGNNDMNGVINKNNLNSNPTKKDSEEKQTSLILSQKPITKVNNSFLRSDIFIQNQFSKLPEPIYKTNSYSDLHLDYNSNENDDDYRLKQIQKNIKHEFAKENKRNLEELYQTYKVSAKLNSILDKPVKPYVSKRQKKSISTYDNNNQQQQQQSNKLINNETFKEDNNNNNKWLFINSLYLNKPSDDYYQSKTFTHIIPSYTTGQLYGHTKGVNVLRWKPDNGYLLASASMDFTACIWDVFNSKKPARIITHQGAVKDIQWRNDNTHVLTASFDKSIKLFDVEAGKVVQTFNNQDMVNVLRFHPKDQDLFIAGLYKKGIVCWDVRSNKIVKEYKGFFGQVQDLEFLDEGKTFLAASDIIKRNSTDKAIVVWDFSGGVIISNQIYQEAYNCTALRVHPNKKKFIAQSNAGYIAIFDAKSPWSLDKFKRFESHSVSGNRIQCNFSPNGKYIGTGSSDGKLYFYDWKTSKCIKTLDYGIHSNSTCMDVSWCPQPQKYGYACVASCDNKGRIALWN
ncbi:WD40 repeat-like protein [Anaeromyces robustus]|uniref:WD40 repeat-like protein n=1 Tax=Anaeromyces robustus TaxID=1754192 RepID=A0A1Y1XM45_9FUNG|nr:WD40 repeat-like protein [Anaeromyces robustus]|eukprot:ORX86802.1 WD40 repeat-like protein [Anaeromyces robustus]